MRLGYIDYLNCYPFYHHMFEIEPLAGIKVFPAYPSELNRMIGADELDMSPISAAAYADLDGDVTLLPEFCLSSVGYVHSVILASAVPIEDLHGKRVGLSMASRTSVVLLKILLERYYGLQPVYVPTGANPSLEENGLDGALIIGNEAMMSRITPYTYDLGDLWMRKTGHPVVFAVFAVRDSARDRYSAEIDAVTGSYRRSLERLDRDRETLIRKARERYPSIIFDVDGYYRVLKYSFNEELRDALAFYLKTAAELGFLKETGRVKFLGAREGGTP